MSQAHFVYTLCSSLIAHSPLLVANLWDVTDRDIDKFSQAVFDSLRLTPTRGGEQSTSVVTAIAQAREVCKLKYLTGAAPVVYGIPFYL
jgi:separase